MPLGSRVGPYWQATRPNMGGYGYTSDPSGPPVQQIPPLRDPNSFPDLVPPQGVSGNYGSGFPPDYPSPNPEAEDQPEVGPVWRAPSAGGGGWEGGGGGSDPYDPNAGDPGGTGSLFDPGSGGGNTNPPRGNQFSSNGPPFGYNDPNSPYNPNQIGSMPVGVPTGQLLPYGQPRPTGTFSSNPIGTPPNGYGGSNPQPTPGGGPGTIINQPQPPVPPGQIYNPQPTQPPIQPGGNGGGDGSVTNIFDPYNTNTDTQGQQGGSGGGGGGNPTLQFPSVWSNAGSSQSDTGYIGSYAGGTTGSSNILGRSGSQTQDVIAGARPWYEEQTGRLAQGYGDLANNVAGSYNSMEGQTGNAYRGLANNVQGAYNTLGGNVLGGMAGLEQNAMGMTNLFGATQKQQLENQFAQSQAQQDQGLENRGLGNSTVVNAVDTGLNQSKGLAETNLAQAVNQQQLGVLGQFGSPIYQQEAAMGQNQIGAGIGVNEQGLQTVAGMGQQGIQAGIGVDQAGLAAQQTVGAQYGGMVGAQGVTTNAAFQNQQQQNQQNQWYNNAYNQTGNNQWQAGGVGMAGGTIPADQLFGQAPQPMGGYNGGGGGGGYQQSPYGYGDPQGVTSYGGGF